MAPPNLPQLDPHLSTLPDLGTSFNSRLTSDGCRPRSSKWILLSILPCVVGQEKSQNWEKWWASEFGRGTLGSELQGRPGRLPADRSVMARTAFSSSSSTTSSYSSWKRPWWQTASPGASRAAKFELLRRSNTPYLPCPIAPTLSFQSTHHNNDY